MALDQEKLRMVFRAIDTDGDGTLNATEIGKAFERNGTKPSLTEIYAMIAEYDTDGVILCLRVTVEWYFGL